MSWYHVPGEQQDVAVCTRVWLARNLAAYPFPHRLEATDAKRVIEQVGRVLEKNGFIPTDLTEISRGAAGSLGEKGFISSRFIATSLPHTLFLNDPCNLSVMVCEEDHIRIQCLLAGISLKDAYEGVTKVEALLDEAMELAFDPRLGYLTADPLRAGSAMEASVLLSLPLLQGSESIHAMAHRAALWGLSPKPCPEGSLSANHLYALHARPLPGETEEELLSHLELHVGQLIEAERRLREELSGEARERMLDRILRARGILRDARMIAAEELVELLGLLRLGAAMGVTPEIKVESLTALLIEAMPATLTLGVEPPPKNHSERDILRARMVQKRLFAEAI